MADKSRLWDQGEDHTVEVNQRALIDKILARYSGEYTIFRELLQNADDANAKSVKIRFLTAQGAEGSLDKDRDLPDLLEVPIHQYVVENDGIPFRDQDWSRLRKIAEGNPDDDKIGAFGVGFYALFSITESPMVESGSKWMGFYWKDGKDQLFARSGTLPEEMSTNESMSGNPWTRFSMDLRNPTPIEGPLDFARFLIQSLTFMNKIRDVQMFVDGWQVLHLTKETGIADARVALSNFPKPKGRVPPQKVMHLNGLTTTNVKISAHCMSWLQDVGLQHVAPLPAVEKAKPAAPGMGFASMFSSVFSRSLTPAKPVAPPPPPPPKPKKDPREVLSTSMMLQVYQADVRITVDRNLEKELERATKKPPPKATVLQLIYSEAPATGQRKTAGATDDIFGGLNPETGGKIFIGQATGQTTGLGGHIAARFIPTVERESIDLMDRFVSIWNKELLSIGGQVARLVYEIQLRTLKEKWFAIQPKRIDLAEASVSPDAAAASELVGQAVHAAKYFTFKRSTPSAQVSQLMEAAFFSSMGDAAIPVLSTLGVNVADKIRMPNPMLDKFLPNLAVLVRTMETEADLFVARLRERGMLSDIALTDVIAELNAAPLDEEQFLACVDWWKQIVNLTQYNPSIQDRLIEATVVAVKDPDTKLDKIVALGAIKAFLNPNMIPAEVPLPTNTLPYTISKRLQSADMINIFGWHELGVAEWARTLSEQDFQASSDAAERLLGVLGRAWPRLSNVNRDELKRTLQEVNCIPTSLGYKKPGEAYHPEVSLFEDLPVISLPHASIKGALRSMLDHLGVRSVVDLQLIFTRLVGKSVWSCAELVKYLSSVRKSLSDHEFARLKRTAAFPIWEPTRAASDKPLPVKRTTPDALCEPTQENKNLGVAVLDYGDHVWRPFSTEATFMYDLGLRKHANLADVLRIAASSDPDQHQKGLDYLVKNLRQYPGFNAPAQAGEVAFVPARTSSGTFQLARPVEVYTNVAAASIGCLVVDRLASDVSAKLQLLKDPPASVLVDYLVRTPPTTVDQGKVAFKYLGTRLPDLHREIPRLSSTLFIPTDKGTHVQPLQTFFTPKDRQSEVYQLYKDLYNFVDFEAGNLFLEQCGVKAQPTQEQIARMLVGDPYGAMRKLASAEKYLSQLRLLATGYSSFPLDLKREMTRASFLLGTKRISTKTSSSAGPGEIGDEDSHIEFSLARASDLAIVDDSYLAKLFADAFVGAPEEVLLEDFYAQLGVKNLSSYIKEEHRALGQTLGATDAAVSLRKHVLERIALFLSDRRASSKYEVEWLKGSAGDMDNLQVLQADSLQIKRTIKTNQAERTSIEPVSAATIKSTGNRIRLYISHRMQLDMYEVALTLCNVLLKRCRNEDVLIFHSILEAPLPVLRRRGYNVDRILNQQKIDRLARVADMEKQAEAEKRTQDERKAIQTVSDEKERAATGPERVPRESSDTASIASKPSDEMSIRSSGIMSQLKSRFRPQSNGSGSAPHVPQPIPASNEVTPMATIKDGALKAVAASRPNKSKSDIVSEPSERMVKESGDTYCDNTGVKTNLIPAGQAPGTSLGLYVSRDVPNPEATIRSLANESRDFASQVLLPLAAVFKLEPTTLNVFYDQAGPLIAFNRNGSLFMNLRYYLAWHHNQVASGIKQEAWTSWFLTMAHECAHNMTSLHDSQHEFWTSSIIETLMEPFVKLLATSR